MHEYHVITRLGKPVGDWSLRMNRDFDNGRFSPNDKSNNSCNLRNNLATTIMFDTHPIVRKSSIDYDMFEYPHPKAYKSKPAHVIQNGLPFDELSGLVRSYHHRFKDPMAYENRHKVVICAQPTAFRRSKSHVEIRSLNLDTYGKPKILSDASIRKRADSINKRSRTYGTRKAIANEYSAMIPVSHIVTCPDKGWTRLSRTNIGIPKLLDKVNSI